MHWRAGHKQVCCEASEKGSTQGNHDPSRPSFSFDITEEKDPFLKDGVVAYNVNYTTGRITSTASKEQRDKLQFEGQTVHKKPNSKNIYGDKEFILKLQPPAPFDPAVAWMCYDGPVRSFEVYINSKTSGLKEVYALLQRDGIRATNPVLGVAGHKGYYMARWEGSSIRVFYDRLVSPPAW